jgi:hypothetical protein
MLGVVGTIPEADFPLLVGPVAAEGSGLRVAERHIPLTRGTAALLAAARSALQVLGLPPPLAVLAGDTGLGEGSEKLYTYLAGHVGELGLSTITFHYILPQVDLHNRVFFALEALHPRPRLIADAGFMYVAKMSGLAPAYDLFTPDAGELAFLADEAAPHPFYTRGFILSDDQRVPDLIARAYAHDNAARWLLVKGSIDYVADKHGIAATVAEPLVEALEPIGGTGDTLTGVVSALVEAGIDLPEAGVLAARANRLAGAMAQPTPATGIDAIVAHLPAALAEVLKK